MLNVVSFLSEYSDVRTGLENLESQFGIKSKIYDNFFVLNYSQIDSPKTHPITMECRGLILDWNLNILRRPFDRFFNYGEANTENFDFKNSFCLEKIDGSLIAAWYNPFDMKWCFGTRGTAFAECECNSGRVFEEIINDCFMTDSKEEVAEALFFDESTFIFELCSPENRVVVPHTSTYLVLLGIRDNISGKYWSLNQCAKVMRDLKHADVKIRLPKTYDLHSLDSIKGSFVDHDTPFFEGYVFWNTQTNERVKVKSPKYVAIHHLRDNGNLNPKRICELVFLNETGEYLSYFPEDKKFFDPWIESFNLMKSTIELMFKDLSKQDLSQKQYAIIVKDKPYSGIMFALRQGKPLEECFSKLSSEAKVRLLECFKDE